MTAEGTSTASKPSELSLPEEVHEAQIKCQTLYSADLNTLMQAVKTVMGFDQAEAGHSEDDLTDDATLEALQAHIAATIRTPLDYEGLCGRNKKLRKQDLDDITKNIADTMAEFYPARINTADKTAAGFQVEAAVVFNKALDDLYGQCNTSMGNISTFVSTTTIARHNAYLADDKAFRNIYAFDVVLPGGSSSSMRAYNGGWR